MSLLPKEPSPPSIRMSDYTWHFYGIPGVGKTTLANQFPNPIFIATESGTEAMLASAVPARSWSELKAVIAELAQGGHGYKTVVLDTADIAYNLCETYVCESNGWNDVADGEWGRGWRTLNREWTNMITQLRMLPMCTVLLGHEKSEMIKEKLGSKMVETGMNRVTTALPNTARQTLHSAVDFIVRCEFTPENERILRTQPVENKRERVEAKARGSKGATLPETIEMSFTALADAFKKTLGTNTKEKK